MAPTWASWLTNPNHEQPCLVAVTALSIPPVPAMMTCFLYNPRQTRQLSAAGQNMVGTVRGRAHLFQLVLHGRLLFAGL